MDFEAVGGTAWFWLTEPLRSLLNPVKRVHLPFLLGATALAALVWLRQHRGRRSLASYLFSRRIWLHRSTLFDAKLAAFRLIFAGVLVVPFAVPVPFAAQQLSLWLWQTVGVAPAAPDLSRATVTVIFSLAAFAAEDLGRYVVHRLAHQVPVLWELHKVHHSAEVLTPLTVYRTHPLESALMRAGAAGSLSLVAGVFVWIFPGKVAALEIFGVYALSYLWNLFGANLRHSHVWLRYPPLLERLLISPAQHQIHHSADLRLFHKNLGSAFALWDWLGGTLVVSSRRPLRYGLPRRERNHRTTLLSALIDPLVAAAARLSAPLRAPRAQVR